MGIQAAGRRRSWDQQDGPALLDVPVSTEPEDAGFEPLRGVDLGHRLRASSRVPPGTNSANLRFCLPISRIGSWM